MGEAAKPQPEALDDLALAAVTGGNLGDTATHEVGHIVQQSRPVRRSKNEVSIETLD